MYSLGTKMKNIQGQSKHKIQRNLRDEDVREERTFHPLLGFQMKHLAQKTYEQEKNKQVYLLQTSPDIGIFGNKNQNTEKQTNKKGKLVCFVLTLMNTEGS